MTYKETKKELMELQIKREEILVQLKEYEEKVAELFQTQTKRVKINATFDRITFNLAKNRHVTFKYSQLEELKNMFECEDMVLRSPIQCKIEIILLYPEFEEPIDPEEPTNPENPGNDPEPVTLGDGAEQPPLTDTE